MLKMSNTQKKEKAEKNDKLWEAFDQNIIQKHNH